MAKDQQAILDLYKKGLGNSTEKYRQGVQNPRRGWKEAASSDESEKRYAAGVQRAAAQKTRQKAVAVKTDDDWRSAALNTGAANLAASAEKAGVNYAKNLPTIMQASAAATQAAAAISGESMEQRLQRGPAAARAVHRTWASKKGIAPEV